MKSHFWVSDVPDFGSDQMERSRSASCQSVSLADEGTPDKVGNCITHTHNNHYSTPHGFSWIKWQSKRSSQVSLLEPAVQDAFKGEGEELEALAWVKLVLELHPVQEIRMKHVYKTTTGKCVTQQHGCQGESCWAVETDDLCSSSSLHPPAPAPGPSPGDRHPSFFPSGNWSGSIFKRLMLNNGWMTF